MLIVYNVLLILYFIVMLPYYAVQMARREKYRAGLKQRLGVYPNSLLTKLKNKTRIWIHAVSVGEVNAVLPLVASLKQHIPNAAIIISTVTLTGQRVAREKVSFDTAVIYYPLDFRFAVKRALRFFSPALIVIAETELWPNFITEASKLFIPLAVINGRISDRSFKRYIRGRFYFKRLLNKIDLFCMQTEMDAGRVIELGAPKGKVKVTGNMKFDCPVEPEQAEEAEGEAARPGIDRNRRTIVAGSTHSGEEEMLLMAYRSIRMEVPETALVIVPRHPERGEEIKRLAESMGQKACLRSRMTKGKTAEPDTVLIVDTIGELLKIYRTADVVFVGKSLVKGGGQNIIEPAGMGKAVIFGPHMQNFREAAELLLSGKAAIQVRSEAELEGALLNLLRDRERRESLGLRAAEIMASNRGAKERNLLLLKELIK